MNQEVYIPGMVGRKILSTLLGLVITAFGAFWLWHPLKLGVTGGDAEAEVIYVEMQKPAQEPVRLTTRKEVANAEDLTRNAVFKYRIRFTTETGETVESYLNYGQVVRPLRSVTDLVRIRYNPKNPQELIEAWSVRSYAFGSFFFVIGLMIVITQAVILRNARRPIVIDPLEALGGK